MIGVPACHLTDSKESILGYQKLGGTIFTWKTVLSHFKEGLPTPNMVWQNGNLYNSIGLPSLSPEYWMKEIAETSRALPNITDKLLVSVGDNIAALLADQLPIHGIELNLQCPNGETSFNPEFIRSSCKRVPVYLKVGYMLPTEFSTLLRKWNFIQGVSLINSTPRRSEELPGRITVGESGPILKDKSLQMLDMVTKVTSGLSLISIGGVSTVEDIHQRFNMGADYVQVCSGIIKNPLLFKEFNEDNNQR